MVTTSQGSQGFPAVSQATEGAGAGWGSLPQPLTAPRCERVSLSPYLSGEASYDLIVGSQGVGLFHLLVGLVCRGVVSRERGMGVCMWNEWVGACVGRWVGDLMSN